MNNIILASSSVTRKVLLERLQVAFDRISPDVDETPLPEELPAALALRLAKCKAQAVAEKFPEAVIIGADQVIMCGKQRLDKPGTVEKARQQLLSVSGRQIHSYTGLCVLSAREAQADVITCQVAFRELTPAMIDDYIARDHPLQCAGSIKAESLGMALFTSFTGLDPTALLGLPLIRLTDMLLQAGIALLRTH